MAPLLVRCFINGISDVALDRRAAHRPRLADVPHVAGRGDAHLLSGDAGLAVAATACPAAPRLALRDPRTA
jgi:3-deoxy-D-arabino-heptulosonate 7-phosphate (DAHP) synthase